ncbi:TIGR03032 family protein [Planktotalea sp.]|uniref:TIGR03032 family protein n=1 Tax=Planktotalea sp. TaxID=2029877 RepID=UPI003D6BB454
MAKPVVPKSGPQTEVLLASQGFTSWLADNGCSVALTTYQAGRLFLIGRKPNGSLRANERLIEQCQGLWTNGRTLWTSGLHTLWRFENNLRPEQTIGDGVDCRFAPREGRVTGQIDIHDIGLGDTNQFDEQTEQNAPGPIFVSTAYNCLATLSEAASFRPLWRPPFISKVVGEDRCHLNGLAMDDDRAAYVSAVSRSDVADGWRERRQDGGVILDVHSGEAVATGLSMPHSPRLYDGKLWVLNSGRGELCTIDPANGEITPIAFCPGFARGLAFVNRFAIVGLSRPRRNQTFEGLELQDLLQSKDTAARCGLLVIDIDTGRTVEWLRFEHTIDELYDIAVLQNVTQPEAIGFQGDAIKTTVQVEM